MAHDVTPTNEMVDTERAKLTKVKGSDAWYHSSCRFKDTEAAAMYERAGYSEAARDIFLLPLLGLQRRFLMSRQMPRRASSERGDLQSSQ